MPMVGSNTMSEPLRETTMCLHEKNCREELHQAVEQTFVIEATGVEPRARINSKDARALKLFDDLMKPVKAGWQSCLL